MKKISFLFSIIFICIIPAFSQRGIPEKNWRANWIGIADTAKISNLWTCYRKEFVLDSVAKRVSFLAQIATDTKYWLWINGKMVVFEGELKRGPTPTSTYFDNVDIKKYLVKGKNTIAILSWYFGKSGFSHNSSGKPGLVFESPALNIYSDTSWRYIVNPAYYKTDGNQPNYRLPEQNVAYDATKEIGKWYESGYDASKWGKASSLGVPPALPWGKLVLRPIPLFKDFGLKDYPGLAKSKKLLKGRKNDTITLKLPYNAQITPYLKVKAKAGQKIHVMTDDYLVGGNKEFQSVRAEYITKKGKQEYESFGWMNGHYVKYIIPKDVKVLDVKFRESGYATELAGKFACEDTMLNKLWLKSQRTLYINMRDNYFDCPDRERAQWWGDVVLEQGEAFYALDENAFALAKKGINEMFEWQKEDNVLYSPIPGNWTSELPQQMLAVVSPFGIGNYYQFTGDFESYKKYYPRVKEYLKLWTIDENGRVVHRQGGWDWGDWGDKVDIEVLDNCWYYLAATEAKKMAIFASVPADAVFWENKLNMIKQNFEANYWSVDHYRSLKYDKFVDDRANAMAVLAGLADTARHKNELKTVLTTQFNASPYLEKYVLEALFKMNLEKEALARMKKRYEGMINSDLTTLWEGWELNENNTYNHGWSGGPLTLLSQYVAGIYPGEAGFITFNAYPRLDLFKNIKTTTQTVRGPIEMDAINTDTALVYNVDVPNAVCNLKVSKSLTSKLKEIVVDGKLGWKDGRMIPQTNNNNSGGGRTAFMAPGGVSSQFYMAENASIYVVTMTKGKHRVVFRK